MYNRGFEAWTAWRTYDMPGFNHLLYLDYLFLQDIHILLANKT
jgi:hypothetical protein